MRLWGRLADPVRFATDHPWTWLVGWRRRRRFRDTETFVLFAGYPRSGHSVIGSLLNAHPEILMAHRARLFERLLQGYRRTQILGALALADARFARLGRVGSKRYDYSVPGQWQGRFTRLRVVGDSSVIPTFVGDRGGLLRRLQRRVGLPLRVVHVVRNPFDNISTMAMRNQLTLPEAMAEYNRRLTNVRALQAEVAPDQWLDVRHEDFVADPKAVLREICGFVGVSAAEEYLAACAGVVFDRPRRTRDDVRWTNEHISEVGALSERFPWLEGYGFDDVPRSA